jgi:hypothetical protein
MAQTRLNPYLWFRKMDKIYLSGRPGVLSGKRAASLSAANFGE